MSISWVHEAITDAGRAQFIRDGWRVVKTFTGPRASGKTTRATDYADTLLGDVMIEDTQEGVRIWTRRTEDEK